MGIGCRQHRYDRFGNRNELTLQDGTNLVHSYGYNKLNQLASASLVGAAVTASYFNTDELQTLTLPNGVSRSYTYKTNGPLDTLTVNGPLGPLAQYAYAYDDALNVDTLTDPDGLHDYGYDGLNRLTSATRPSGLGLPNESYAYDRVGNREDPGNAALYNYDNNNRMSASPALTYTFDADGSLATRSDGATFSHDARNRLVQYAKSGTTASYRHDPLGRRIQKTVNGTTTWFLWDGSRLLAEYGSSGNRQQRYAYLEGYAPAQVEDANGVYYLHADHLDTPRLLTNGTGAIAWRARYEAFGKATVEADPDANGTPITLNLRFPGQYFDAESGLHQNYFREYDPTIGRYVQSDPIGQAGGINVYLYAKSNPTRWVDPRGLDGCTRNEVAANSATEDRWDAEVDLLDALTTGDKAAEEDARRRIDVANSDYDKALCCKLTYAQTSKYSVHGGSDGDGTYGSDGSQTQDEDPLAPRPPPIRPIDISVPEPTVDF